MGTEVVADFVSDTAFFVMKQKTRLIGEESGLYNVKKQGSSDMTEDYMGEEELQTGKERWEKMILGQIAGLLAEEDLINPKEQIHFLSLVHKGE